MAWILTLAVIVAAVTLSTVVLVSRLRGLEQDVLDLYATLRERLDSAERAVVDHDGRLVALERELEPEEEFT